jgi:carbonic anhydrase/acetyltransferase-like protein (isoleucine patch superfamily)
MIYAFDGFIPVVHESAFIHPQAAVTGNVMIGRDVYVGPGAAIRGDWGGIVIEDGCNVQENCTIHMFPGVVVVLEAGAHIGHGAVVHGARIGANALIGMNAVVMDNAIVGSGCVVGALCFVPTGMEIPPRKVVVGNPAKIIKDVTDEMLAWKSAGTALYEQLPAAMRDSWKPVEPLRAMTESRPSQSSVLKNWQETQRNLPGSESNSTT